MYVVHTDKLGVASGRGAASGRGVASGRAWPLPDVTQQEGSGDSPTWRR